MVCSFASLAAPPFDDAERFVFSSRGSPQHTYTILLQHYLRMSSIITVMKLGHDSESSGMRQASLVSRPSFHNGSSRECLCLLLLLLLHSLSFIFLFFFFDLMMKTATKFLVVTLAQINLL